MFFCLAFKNTGICSVLCISGPKSTGIYSIFCVLAWLPPTTLKRKNVVIYSILWLPKSEKSSEKCVKTVLFSDFWDLQNASSNFTLFLSTPDPEKRENPTRLKDFWGGSAAGARPRVAKAMLSFPTRHGEASPDYYGATPPAADPWERVSLEPFVCLQWTSSTVMAADAQSKSHLDRWWPKLAGVDVASMASRHSWNLNGIRRSAIRKMNIQRAQGNRNHRNSQCICTLDTSTISKKPSDHPTCRVIPSVITLGSTSIGSLHHGVIIHLQTSSN